MERIDEEMQIKPISHWIGENGAKYFSVDSLLEKLEDIDDIDMENIRLILNKDKTNDSTELNIAVRKKIIGLLTATLSYECDNMRNIPNVMDDIKSDKCGFVYIARCDSSNIYKIGKANEISKREKQLRTGNMFLEMFAYTKSCNPLKLESLLHKIYVHKRLSGEWFELNKDEIDDIIQSFGFTIALDVKAVTK
jgi:hypothetical protein